jgi:hypothetical protein
MAPPPNPRASTDRVWWALAIAVAAFGVCQAWPKSAPRSRGGNKPAAHQRADGPARPARPPDRAPERERVIRP